MKEIIIDGVNVAECKEIANYENVLFVCHETGQKCELNTNCYFKQLQRAKQENAELKEALKTLAEGLNIRQQTLQEIKAIAEALSCKHPEDCWENKPDWNGEVYGCDVADNWKEPSELATCPSKLASAILQIITKAEVGE